MSALPETPGRKLRLFQQSDPLKQWWSLGELRFCAKCEHLFSGHEIHLTEEADGTIRFHCPTLNCPGQWEDWQYPELHL
jgi:hypothetical protein